MKPLSPTAGWGGRAMRCLLPRLARLPAPMPVLSSVLSLVLALVMCLAAMSATAQAFTTTTLVEAERWLPGTPVQRVSLPDWVRAPAAAPGPVEARYRFEVDLGPAPTQSAIYLSGVFGHTRIAVNGRVINDGIREPLTPSPRGAGRLRLVDIPGPYLQPGLNRVEITLRAETSASLSPVQIGPPDRLRALRDRKVFGLVYGPGLVAAIMGCMGLSVLLLYLRRPQETLYAYFGAAALAWGLHTLWTVLPAPLFTGYHEAVWWTSLYSLVVVALANFALRFADYRWPRLERALWGASLCAPLVFYAAQALDALNPTLEAWRLGMVVVAFGGMAAVAYSAWHKRSTESALLVLAGVSAASLGLIDWLRWHAEKDNLPVSLAPWAGLPFVVLVTWFLIDRFVRTTESLETMNRELETRVARKSAELGAALESMRVARDAAEAANRAKSSFLAAASHDLRQPMHALGLYMAALRSQPLSKAQQELTARMEGSVSALESMFDSLLDISRMDAGVVVPEPRAFDIDALVRRLAAEFAADAERGGLRLAVRVGAGARELRAWTDPMLLERVLRNLLNNAVKYTRDGGVLITCRLRRGPPPRWRIEVWDTGAGIPVHEQKRVFDEFYQVGNPERDRQAGLGIGLSVVRRLTGLLGLPLALHSQPGRGSRFGVDVPATADVEASPAQAPLQAGSVADLCVAVIEDDPEVRDSMQQLLASWGCRVAAGADAAEVAHRAQLQGLTLDAVIADLRLRKGRDGLGEIAALRRRCAAALPALLVSGDSAPERVALMQHSGLPWLAKPVPAARLRSWLVAAVRAEEKNA